LNFHSHALAEFWDCYNALPTNLQRLADKQFVLFLENPNHPSLQFKPVGNYWGVRVSGACRALARRRDQDLFWFWIGGHDEYEALIERS